MEIPYNGASSTLDVGFVGLIVLNGAWFALDSVIVETFILVSLCQFSEPVVGSQWTIIAAFNRLIFMLLGVSAAIGYTRLGGILFFKHIKEPMSASRGSLPRLSS